MGSGSMGNRSNVRLCIFFLFTAAMVMALFLRWEEGAVSSDSKTRPSGDSRNQRMSTSNELLHNAESTAVQPHPRQIKQISLIGERNSGTKWIWAHLAECFNYSIPVEKKLVRYKHWFQSKTYDRYPHDTLVIEMFRNPYDWFRAMQRIPHHSPAHFDLQWEEFLTKEWTMERFGADLNLTGNEYCQHHYYYRDIVSCVHQPLPTSAYDHKLRYSEEKPFYEMRNDGSGLPYDNIMEFRTDKIRNFVEVKDFPGVADMWIVHYEYLLGRGTKPLMDRIQAFTGIPYQCNPSPPQIRRKRNITKEYVQFVNDHLDWDAEAAIGYEAIPL